MDSQLSLTGALLLGMATSLHCVGMCGPVACGLGGLAKSEGERLTGAVCYHVTRMVAYGIIGGVCGALGREPLKWFFNSPAVVLPWVLVVLLLVVGLGLDKRVPQPVFFSRFAARLRFKAMRLPAPAAGALMGAATPFLPCGPLYAVFVGALAAGSAARGMETLLAFGLGTVPLLWVAQWQFEAIRKLLGPQGLRRVQRGLALVTALILAWRLHGTIPPQWYGGTPPPPNKETGGLPSCCH